MKYLKLFSELPVGRMTLKNRIVMSPMTRCRATNNIPNEMMAQYYSLRAQAGLIITEGTSPSPNGLGYARIPGNFNIEQSQGWRKVANAVHARQGHIFMQLMHTGRVSHPLNMSGNSKILAPSAIALTGEMWTDQKQMQPYPIPEAMSKQQIKEAVSEYAHSARLAIDSGMDGIELHGANGYLIDQFLNPATNQRQDEYGGTPENRLRFALEVAKAVVSAIDPDRVGIRLSPYGVFNDMKPFDGLEEFYGMLAKRLNELNLLYIHCVDHHSMGAPEVTPSVKALLRKEFKHTLILSGGYDADRAEHDLLEGKADLIAFGRPFLANPNFVEKIQIGAPIIPANPATFYTPGELGYTVFPKEAAV
ncbi:MAG: alkene reductase [Bdellovibrionales bacterium GWA2_49_15]|nr:MAG: alkene reductase [Bdellovibrionales bacterium GWA2_49_15]HAZ13829.1 alkene reductase [Bdellovibrionales bacterium]